MYSHKFIMNLIYNLTRFAVFTRVINPDCQPGSNRIQPGFFLCVTRMTDFIRVEALVPAAFYYCRSFFMCDFVAAQNRKLIIFPTYLIKVTIKKTNKEKNF